MYLSSWLTYSLRKSGSISGHSVWGFEVSVDCKKRLSSNHSKVSKRSIFTPLWPDEFAKSRPKCSPIHFLLKVIDKFYRGKSSPVICASSLIFTKLPKVNSHPIGKNSPNLVTLIHSQCITNKVFFEANLQNPAKGGICLDRNRQLRKTVG
jgi:hypothetical protein